MRRKWIALGLLSVGLTAGCMSSQRKPFANNPLLLYYKPTLSDSATILAEQAARREPNMPPMPAFARQSTPAAPSLLLRPEPGEIKPAKAETPLPDIRPVIRQSSAASHPPDLKIEFATPVPPVSTDIKPVILPATEFVAKRENVETPFTPPETKSAAAHELVITAPPVALTAPSTDGVSLVSTSAIPVQQKKVAGSYGHDADYRWLQGVVQRLSNGGCYIRYCDPSVEDEHGGKVRVEDESRVTKFRDGDVIGVKGELIPAGPKAGQVPLFRISEIWAVKTR